MWRNRAILIGLGVAAPVVSFYLMVMIPREEGKALKWWPEGPISTIILPLVLAASLVFGLIVLIIWRRLAIHAVEISNNQVVLANVAQQFLEAFEEKLSSATNVSESPTAVESSSSKKILFTVAVPELQHLPPEKATEILDRCLESPRLRTFRKRWVNFATIGLVAIVILFIPLWGTGFVFLFFPALFVYIILAMILKLRAELRLIRRLLHEELRPEDTETHEH
jgi:hypothetical protein